MKKWEDRKDFNFSIFCLVGVEKWRDGKISLYKFIIKKWWPINTKKKKKKKKQSPNLLKKKSCLIKQKTKQLSHPQPRKK